MNITRREMLKLSTGAAALLATGVRIHGAETVAKATVTTAADSGATQAKKIPIAVQLYSVRSEAPQNKPETFKALAEIGFQGVEFFSGYINNKAEDLRKMLDDAQIVACGAHTDWKLLQGDNFQKTIEFNKILGNKLVTVPSLPNNLLSSEAAIVSTAGRLTELCDKAKEHGIRIGYHSHDQDFRKIGGLTVWEILFNAAGPDVVAQIDLGHCVTGGGDPLAMIEKFAKRTATLHITDGHSGRGGKRKGGTLVGKGDVPWEQIFKILDAAGKTQWLVVEQEVNEPGASFMQCCKKDLEFLKKLGR
jgi:sugar phosphate isomerase/epimerase